MRSHRGVPRERFIDALRGTIVADKQILRALDKTQMWSGRVLGLMSPDRPVGRGKGRSLWDKVPFAQPERIDAAQKYLQHMDGAASLKPLE